MKTCDRCNGEGRGHTLRGTAWRCDYCEGSGKISKYPPRYCVDAAWDSRSEPLLDRG
jgi:DnaJ-class molecular chaperone